MGKSINTKGESLRYFIGDCLILVRKTRQFSMSSAANIGGAPGLT